ncbi:hypothetical protein [Rhizobium leguminosarum]|uniref:hypothetical protein n=1 Tax=Rhizobium leguminosarum TaxID=384 RepID=UPI002F958F5B
MQKKHYSDDNDIDLVSSRALIESDVWQLRRSTIGTIIVLSIYPLSYVIIFSIVDRNTLTAVKSVLFNQAPYILVFIGFAISLALFWLRGNFPKIYGNAEVLVGILSIKNAAPATINADVPSLLSFMAAIYVIIRGLDNIAKGLKPNGWWREFFTQIFNNPAKKQ